MAVTAAQTTTTKKVCNAQKEGHHCNISHTKDERQTCAVSITIFTRPRQVTNHFWGV